VNVLSTFLTKSPAIPQQLYKTASRSLSAIAELLIFFMLLEIAQRPPSRSSPNLPGRWRMGCNRKIKLLVSELCLGGMDVQEDDVRFRPNYIKCNMAAKWIYLSKKGNCLILAGLFCSLKTAGKSVNERPRFFDTFVPSLDSDTA